jgi:hypothetical protein
LIQIMLMEQDHAEAEQWLGCCHLQTALERLGMQQGFDWNTTMTASDSPKAAAQTLHGVSKNPCVGRHRNRYWQGLTECGPSHSLRATPPLCQGNPAASDLPMLLRATAAARFDSDTLTLHPANGARA